MSKKIKAKKVAGGAIHTDELADELCARIALGGSLRKICSRDGMPSLRLVFQWRKERADFHARLEAARELRAESRAERVDEILEELKAGAIDAHAARVMVDAIKWQAACEAPKRFSEKRELNVNTNENHLRLTIQNTAEWIERLLGAGEERAPPTGGSTAPASATRSLGRRPSMCLPKVYLARRTRSALACTVARA